MSYRKKHIAPKIKGLRRKRRFFQKPLFWLFLLFAMGVGVVFYLLFFFPLTQVSRVEILGNGKVQAFDIENLAWTRINKKILGFSHKSIFWASGEKISSDITDVFGIVETASVQKKLPDTILIKIKERKPYAIFCASSIEGLKSQANPDLLQENNTSNCFWLDKTGVIFELADGSSEGSFIVRQNNQSNQAYLGQHIIGQTTMDAIVAIQKNLQDNFQIGITSVDISDLLIVTTKERWRTYFDLGQDIQLQITKMNILLKDQITPTTRKNLQYIYLQYKDRAYYK